MNEAAGSLTVPGTLSGVDVDRERVEAVTREVESLFVSMLIKEMRKSASGGLFPGDNSDTYGGMFDDFMGKHIAAAGGIGLKSLMQNIDMSDARALSAIDGLRETSHQQAVERYQHVTTAQ